MAVTHYALPRAAMTTTIPPRHLIAGAPVLAVLWAVSKAIAWLGGGSGTRYGLLSLEWGRRPM